MNTNRVYDNACEAIVSSKMDEVYKNNNIPFERITSYYEQICGIDVIMKNGDSTYFVDEKSANKFLNKRLETYSFEISTENNVDKSGWFTSPISRTTHYMLIYPQSTTNDIRNITSIEAYLVSKEKIKSFIDMCGINTEEIISKIKEIPPESNGKSYIRCKNFVKCVYSKNIIPERPINILIPRNTLKILAEKKIFVNYEENK